LPKEITWTFHIPDFIKINPFCNKKEVEWLQTQELDSNGKIIFKLMLRWGIQESHSTNRNVNELHKLHLWLR